jgi:hypothetical protein
MASRVSFDHWMLRDWPQAKLVLVWIAFACSIFFYFSDWPSPRRQPVVMPQFSNAYSDNKNDDEIYTGSIRITPTGGDQCRERKFDNRTGKMRGKGFVNCEVVTPQEKNTAETMGDKRIRAIIAYFHNGN